MSTATRVPEIAAMRGEELSAEDAWTTLRRYPIGRLVKGSYLRFRYSDGFTHARALALQFCLAIIPLVIAVVGLTGTLHQAKLGRALVSTLQHLMPGQGRGAISQSLERARAGGGLALALGLIAGLVSLTLAMGQVERGANRIYGIERDRPTRRKYQLALLLAVTAGLASLLGFVMIVGGGALNDALTQVYRKSTTVHTLWAVLRWPLGILLTLVAITTLLKYAPRRRQPGYSWLAVGALVGLVLWLLFSLLLALYAATSSTFGSLYGPLTGVFALMIWANLTSIALFLGVAFAAQLEAVRAGVPRPVHPDPERAPTTRGDHPPLTHRAAADSRR
jgi:YihY family inner membrane protein